MSPIKMNYPADLNTAWRLRMFIGGSTGLRNERTATRRPNGGKFLLRQVAHAKIMGCASLVPGNAGSLAPRKQLRRGAITAKFISAKNVRDKKKNQRPSKNPHRAKVILNFAARWA